MSSARDSLMKRLLRTKNPDLTAEEQKILRNALIDNLNQKYNGLNVSTLRRLYKHISDQKGVSNMTRASLVVGLQQHFAGLLQSDVRQSEHMSASVPPPLVQPRNPMDVFQRLIPSQYLVNILDRYSIPPPPIEGKFVKEIALDGVPRYVVCHAGKAYVTHAKGGKMSVLDVESGAVVEEWTIPGAGWLGGVAVYGEHVFVADYEKHCIRVLDMEGKQERQFGTYGSGIGQFNHPTGMAIANELLYVCDLFNDRVQVFGLDGTWVRSWGSEGAGEGQFNCPGGITVHGDEVYVADRYNHRVQVFGLDGRFRRMWGSKGTGAGKFKKPNDVIVHGELVYVTDGANDRVQSFRASDGEFVGSWGSHGTAAGEFEFHAEGLCLDDRGRLWVCDFMDDRLQLFR